MEKKNIKLEALKKKLTELFQLDKADLDFGIYRILNQKRKDVEHFIESDLPEIVNEELSKYDSGKNVELQSELDNAIKNAKELGVDPESTDKVKELRTQLKESVSKDDIEAEVYSSLTDFFSRYYDEGDFISQRRYKDGVYAIPYEGEEVKLHWANADQYYIKTSEDFANFSFYIDEAQTKRVSFQIAKAETEKDNNKEADSKKRRFALVSDAPVELVDGTLVIRFTYEVNGAKQESLNQQAEELVKQLLPQEFSELFAKAPTEKDKNRTVFGKWLGHYTSKNTFDYFIHKDLNGFLGRELDFYIKNELLRIDDLDAFAEATNSRLVSKIKVFKHIAGSIINFISQLEDFQRMLWEKRKFIHTSEYCLTLDLLSDETLILILENEDQIKEWVSLGMIDSNSSLTLEFLRSHESLVIDTKFFTRDQRMSILSSIYDLDTQLNGLLINSDNFAAVRLLDEKYKSGVKCIYLDPPYNTSASEIVYKNGLKNSSWLTLLASRLELSKTLLCSDGILQIAIDDEEMRYLHLMLDEIYSNSNFLANIAIMQNPRGRSDAKHIAPAHEYLLMYAKSIDSLTTNQLVQSSDEITKKYPKVDEISRYRELPLKRSGSNSRRTERPNLYYPLYFSIAKNDLALSKVDDTYSEIFPRDNEGVERCWRWGRDKVAQCLKTELIVKNTDRGYSIIAKDRVKLEMKPKSMWYGPRHDASSHGTMLLKDLFGDSGFSYPKSINTVMDALTIGSNSDSLIMDYFAGSGTTAHAVINLNRNDTVKGIGLGKRKFVLVEMGSYFDTVTLPRVKKNIFSDKWRQGKSTDAGMTGSKNQILKYLKLESYEDALNNLVFAKQTDVQRSFLENDKTLERNYCINYMLDFESQDSRSLLDIKQFEDPFNYEMLIQDNSNRLVPKNVDLVDTFNYLIGLNVDHIEQKKGFVVVQGKQNDGTRTLVIWRNVNENPNDKLNEFLEKSAYNPRDGEFDVIYVNGDNNVENLQTSDDAWKVRLIEEEFHKRMFN